MSFSTKSASAQFRIRAIYALFRRLMRRFRVFVARLRGHPQSAEYLAWRRKFLGDRLYWGVWATILSHFTFTIQGFSELLRSTEKVRQELIEATGKPEIFELIKSISIVTSITITGLLFANLLLLRSPWGKRHVTALFLCFSWSITLVPQIIGTLMGLPSPNSTDWILMFLGQAILIPVHWRLQAFSQVPPLLYYLGVNPLLGTTSIGELSIYSDYDFIFLFWVCLISIVSVFTYDRLKQSEFESRRELQLFLHAVSHDLRAPVTGTSIVLQSLLNSPDDKVWVDRADLQWLLQGCDRQLTLINSLLEAHAGEMQALTMQPQPLQLSDLVNSVLSELQPSLAQGRVVVSNQVSDRLPQVYADSDQLWRVLCNLITNSLKHNPPEIQLTLSAEVVNFRSGKKETAEIQRWTTGIQKIVEPKPQTCWLLCRVQDNGMGIEAAQQKRLFELYTRGTRARYMPGLGLGLYLCRQIVTAHGGEMGVISNLHQGTEFWFTLPIYTSPDRSATTAA